MTQADHDRDNKTTGSSFNLPICNFQSRKQNNGIMHTSLVHINHYWVSISIKI